MGWSRPARQETLTGFIGGFILRQRRDIFLLGLVHLGWALDWIAMPYMVKWVINTVILHDGNRANAWSALAAPVAGVLGFWLFVEILYRLSDFLAARVYPQFEANVRMASLDYLRHHSHRFFAGSLSGDLASKVDDLREGTSRILQISLSTFIPSGFAIVLATAIYFTLHPLFGLLVATWFSIHVAICIYFAKDCDAAANTHSEAKSQLNGQIVDQFANMSAVRLFSRLDWEWNRSGRFQACEQTLHRRLLVNLLKVRLILGAFCFVTMGCLMMALMIFQWQRGVIDAGDFTYIFYSGWGICVMAWISGIEMPNLFKEMGKCRQALRPLIVPHEIVDAPDARPLVIACGEVRFDNVSFHYDRGRRVFENKTITIEPGTKVGLVGASGSGKSTFVNLLTRLYEVESGQITIDGQDIRQVTQESLHQQIAVIPQDTSLFHRSVMDNIRYGKIDASESDVIEASVRANCHTFISELKNGYDSLVGERGIMLSGGQRQRIAIARAFLKNAPILVLDEATSALDSITEAAIQISLMELMAGRTTIAIAHRLSTLASMDRLLVFNEGRIVEDGTHNDLLRLDQLYADLWKTQTNGFLVDGDDSETEEFAIEANQ